MQCDLHRDIYVSDMFSRTRSNFSQSMYILWLMMYSQRIQKILNWIKTVRFSHNSRLIAAFNVFLRKVISSSKIRQFLFIYSLRYCHDISMFFKTWYAIVYARNIHRKEMHSLDILRSTELERIFSELSAVLRETENSVSCIIYATSLHRTRLVCFIFVS